MTVLLGPGVSTAAPQAAVPPVQGPSVQTPEQEELELREREAAGDLVESSAEVKAAGAALRTIAAQLPAARADVDRARGELVGAQAKAARAQQAVARAEAALSAAKAETDAAGAKVEQGRQSVNRLARRAYQRGALGDLREVVDAGSPQDVLVRAGLLQSVFRHNDDTLTRLTEDRLALARQRASLASEDRELQAARDDARREADRARRITTEAEQAAARVADLVARRETALAAAETNRAQDLRDYQAAQRASEELAERIREAARQAAIVAAAEERRRKAAEAAAEAEAAREAARRRAANQPPAPRRPSQPSRRAERTDGMVWPTPGQLTSDYGYRTHPIYGDRRFHAGIDVSGGEGAPIRAAAAGTVISTGPTGGYGNLTVISHGVVDGRDLTTTYAHQSAWSVEVGQRVERGQRIGAVGSTGNVTGPHLHFEVRVDGDPVDPLDYVSPP